MAKSFDRYGRVVAHDSKYTGEEPKWDDFDHEDSELFLRRRGTMFNFYNYYLTAKELKPFTLKWMKDNGYKKEDIKRVKSLDNTTPSPTVGKLCRANQMGMPLEHHNTADLAFVRTEIAKAIRSIPKVVASTEEAEGSEDKKVVLNPAQLLKDKVNRVVVSELDKMLDDEGWADGKKCNSINLFNLLKGENIATAGLKPVEAWLDLYYNEYNDALEGKCEQAVEACSHLNKSQLKRRVKLLGDMKNDLLNYRASSKSKRKPRVKKAPTADKQVKKLKYQEECNENKVSSVSPLTLPGSKESYFFNTKYNQLIYVSSPMGLNIKGTSLKDYDEGSSYKVTLRKPEEVLPIITSKGKRAIDNVLKGLTTKKRTFTGRLNENTIILKVS